MKLPVNAPRAHSDSQYVYENIYICIYLYISSSSYSFLWVLQLHTVRLNVRAQPHGGPKQVYFESVKCIEVIFNICKLKATGSTAHAMKRKYSLLQMEKASLLGINNRLSPREIRENGAPIANYSKT